MNSLLDPLSLLPVDCGKFWCILLPTICPTTGRCAGSPVLSCLTQPRCRLGRHRATENTSGSDVCKVKCAPSIADATWYVTKPKLSSCAPKRQSEFPSCVSNEKLTPGWWRRTRNNAWRSQSYLTTGAAYTHYVGVTLFGLQNSTTYGETLWRIRCQHMRGLFGE